MTPATGAASHAEPNVRSLDQSASARCQRVELSWRDEAPADGARVAVSEPSSGIVLAFRREAGGGEGNKQVKRSDPLPVRRSDSESSVACPLPVPGASAPFRRPPLRRRRPEPSHAPPGRLRRALPTPAPPRRHGLQVSIRSTSLPPSPHPSLRGPALPSPPAY